MYVDINFLADVSQNTYGSFAPSFVEICKGYTTCIKSTLTAMDHRATALFLLL